MNEVTKEFVSEEKPKFKWKIGKVLASSLSGFIAGLIVATICFITIFDVALK